MREISKDTSLCISLAGRPSNIGTRFHNYLYDELGIDFVYKAFTTHDIAAAIGGVRALGIRGCCRLRLCLSFRVAEPYLRQLPPFDWIGGHPARQNHFVRDSGALLVNASPVTGTIFSSTSPSPDTHTQNHLRSCVLMSPR